MSIVSISEAARLTGKARSTIQAHIKTGKISKTTEHHTSTTTDQNIEILQLKLENDRLKSVLEAKQETIDTLKSALKLLEYKQAKDDVHNVDTIPTKEPEPPLNEVETTGNLGLLGRFKKLFS